VHRIPGVVVFGGDGFSANMLTYFHSTSGLWLLMTLHEALEHAADMPADNRWLIFSTVCGGSAFTNPKCEVWRTP
jgi:hypothetical protein